MTKFQTLSSYQIFFVEIDLKTPVQKKFAFDHNNHASNRRILRNSWEDFPLSKQAHSKQLALAVDLGGSYIRVALVDDRGKIEEFRKTRMVDCPEQRIAIIIELANVSSSALKLFIAQY